jgi:hypothetical protein
VNAPSAQPSPAETDRQKPDALVNRMLDQLRKGEPVESQLAPGEENPAAGVPIEASRLPGWDSMTNSTTVSTRQPWCRGSGTGPVAVAGRRGQRCDQRPSQYEREVFPASGGRGLLVDPGKVVAASTY